MPPRGFSFSNCSCCARNSVRLDALESRLQALENVGLGETRTPGTALCMDNNTDFHLPQESAALANATTCDTIVSADLAANVRFNHNYAWEEGLASVVEDNARIGAQYFDEQMGNPDFGDNFDIGVVSAVQDPGVQPDMLSSIESQDVQAASISILNNTATFTPPVPRSLPSVSVPLASINAMAPVAPRSRCTICNTTYSRPEDLSRHARKHNPNATRYYCPKQGCRFSGPSGVLRKDDLRKHQARRGHY